MDALSYYPTYGTNPIYSYYNLYFDDKLAQRHGFEIRKVYEKKYMRSYMMDPI